MTSERLQKALNEEQLAAVTAPDGPVLVIAAAGTGKTRTLTYRVAWLVERGVEPQRILLLTFTNRAAREMLDRARRLVGEGVSSIWGGTFHHMANRLLRRHAERLGYRPDYVILDQEDSRALIRECMNTGMERSHMPKPEVLQAVYSLAANRQAPVEEAIRKRFEGHDSFSVPDMLQVYESYAKRKRELNAMDFDDLLANALRLFREYPDLLEYYQRHFEHILVDEYQDTNSLQAEWVDLLAAKRRQLFVVGDDFQSIYSWRGADYRNILDFPKRYSDAKIYLLETNYRSVPGILNVANACIAGNPEQFQKNLKPVRKGGCKPELLLLRSDEQQTAFVLNAVQQLLLQGYALKDIVVLYRAHYQAMELQLALTRERVPFIITSGVRFFEQAHVKDVCSVLRLWANPGDELAFLRLLPLLPKVGARTAADIWLKLGKRADIRDAQTRETIRNLLPAAACEDWDKIVNSLPDAEKNGLSSKPGEFIQRFLTAFYSDFLLENYENAERRGEDIEALADYAGRYETPEDFLNEMALQTNLDAETDEFLSPEDAVLKLSTVHQAKGLEWKVVFLLWMVDGMFPSGRSLADGAEDEERRLFYVAVTRARDMLYLCAPTRRVMRDGGSMSCAPSRFILEIPQHHLSVQHVW